MNRPRREQAVREMVRVLKPAGRLALADVCHAAAYAAVLRAAGMEEVRLSGPDFFVLRPDARGDGGEGAWPRPFRLAAALAMMPP